MNRTTHQLVQGTQEWHQHRNRYFNASEAAAMLGISPYKTRSQLLHEKATGLTKDIDGATQRVFDNGHRFEAIARTWAEEIIGEELFSPTTSIELEGLMLSASIDGITMDDSIAWEHKTLNADLAESLAQGIIPHTYHPQLEQILLVTGAEKVLFMASNGSRESMQYLLYYSDGSLRNRLISGWKQFQSDLFTYTPTSASATPVAAPVTALPAIVYRLNGLVLTSNLGEYKQAAMRLVEESKRPLETDQDFADCEAQIKAFKAAEERIAAVRSQVVGEVKDIDTFQRELGDIAELIRQARLNGEKQVKSKKESIRLQVQQDAQHRFTSYVCALNEQLGRPYMPAIAINIGEAMKGKKTIDTLKDSANSELLRAMAEADKAANIIGLNMATLREKASAHTFLFADARELVQKDPEAVAAIVSQRIAEHEAAEQRRIEIERERIQREEQRKAEMAAAAAEQRLKEKELALAEAQACAEAAAQQTAQPVAAQPALAPHVEEEHDLHPEMDPEKAMDALKAQWNDIKRNAIDAIAEQGASHHLAGLIFDAIEAGKIPHVYFRLER